MRYQLFISENCSDCEKLLSEHSLPWEMIEKKWLNDQTSQANFPIIIPALQKGQKLLAYGYDQISLILKSNNSEFKKQISFNKK